MLQRIYAVVACVWSESWPGKLHARSMAVYTFLKVVFVGIATLLKAPYWYSSHSVLQNTLNVEKANLAKVVLRANQVPKQLL